jgi:hypothetical protein
MKGKCTEKTTKDTAGSFIDNSFPPDLKTRRSSYSDLQQQNAISSPVFGKYFIYIIFTALCYGREKLD